MLRVLRVWLLGAGAARSLRPEGPAGEVSCGSRAGRSSNDAPSSPRRPMLEGVWAPDALTMMAGKLLCLLLGPYCGLW